MEKTEGEGQPSTLVVAAETEPTTPVGDTKPTQLHQFNEQTNYVPVKTIITVSAVAW